MSDYINVPSNGICPTNSTKQIVPWYRNRGRQIYKEGCVCNSPYVLNNNTCKCPPGYYLNPTTNKCNLCDTNYINNNNYNQSSCNICPINSYTLGNNRTACYPKCGNTVCDKKCCGNSCIDKNMSCCNNIPCDKQCCNGQCKDVYNNGYIINNFGSCYIPSPGVFFNTYIENDDDNGYIYKVQNPSTQNPQTVYSIGDGYYSNESYILIITLPGITINNIKMTTGHETDINLAKIKIQPYNRINMYMFETSGLFGRTIEFTANIINTITKTTNENVLFKYVNNSVEKNSYGKIRKVIKVTPNVLTNISYSNYGYGGSTEFVSASSIADSNLNCATIIFGQKQTSY